MTAKNDARTGLAPWASNAEGGQARPGRSGAESTGVGPLHSMTGLIGPIRSGGPDEVGQHPSVMLTAPAVRTQLGGDRYSPAGLPTPPTTQRAAEFGMLLWFMKAWCADAGSDAGHRLRETTPASHGFLLILVMAPKCLNVGTPMA